MNNFTPRTELTLLLEEFMAEERSFQQSLQKMKCDNQCLADAHKLVGPQLDKLESHGRLRAVHEAMFKVHRKIQKEHELATQRCSYVLQRLSAGLYNAQEIAFELTRLGQLRDKIRGEQNTLQVEREIIIAEHQEIVKSITSDLSH